MNKLIIAATIITILFTVLITIYMSSGKHDAAIEYGFVLIALTQGVLSSYSIISEDTTN